MTVHLPLPLGSGLIAGVDLGPRDRPVDLILLHATGFNGCTYAPLVAPLAQRWRIVLPDARGHGRTTLGADPGRLTGWNIYGRDLVRLLDAVVDPARPPVLAGHSMGAITALLAASARPGLCRGLLLIDPVMAARRWSWFARLPGAPRLLRRLFPIAARAAQRRASFPDRAAVLASYCGRGVFKSWQDGYLEAYLADGLLDAPDGVRLACAPAWEAATFSAMRHNWRRALARVTCPVHIVAAEHGSTVGIPQDSLPCSYERAPGAGHMIPMEQPDFIRQRIEAALTA